MARKGTKKMGGFAKMLMGEAHPGITGTSKSGVTRPPKQTRNSTEGFRESFKKREPFA